MTKLVVIIGATGNQGGSVATRFLQDPNYKVRGITRNPSSPAALALSAKGAEVVAADLDDTDSLIKAFEGANLIFSITNYWEPFFRPDCRLKASEKGITPNKYAYDVEFQQGKNIADAVAANVTSLDENGFIASTLSHAGKCSKGAYKELYHFDSKADAFPYYVESKYPEVVKKMSCIQTGYFMSSYNYAPSAYFGKQEDGSYLMTFPTTADAQVPHLDVNADVGNFVYAVSQLPPGKSYMCAGSFAPWSEYIRLWAEFNNVKGKYQEISLEQFIEASPDKAFGIEAGDMFAYSSDPGYDGGDVSLLKADDIRKLGIELPMTTLEDYMKKQDWTALL